MPTQVQFRRGTTAQNNSFTGAIGEISVNTSNNTLRVHDGSTTGGFELARRGNVSVLTTSSSAELAAIISDETGSGSLVFATTPTLVTPVLGLATGTSVMLSANVGAAAGNVSGNFTAGNFQSAGNVNTASALFTGSITGGTIQTAGNVNSASGLVTGSLTAGTLQTAGNINANNLRVVTNSSVGTVVSGTWQGTTIGTAYGGTGVTSSTGTGSVVLSASPTFTGNILAASLTLSGDLIVSGTTTTINSTTLTVDDKNIELGSVASPSDVTADGGGITLKGATDKTLNWVSATAAWTSSEDFNLLTGKVYEINGTTVLSSSTLGSGVTASSLTSVGTLGSLAVTNNVSAGAFLTAGNSTAANFQSTGNVNTASALFTGSITGGTIQTAGNVNSSSLRVTTASSLGTVQSGTWQGSEIATTYTAAKVTSVNGSTGAVSGLATTAGTLAQFGATTSSQLLGVISDETGSGALVFATSPTLVTPALGTPSAIVLTNATGTASNLTANIANFISISDDTTTNATRYPIFANGTSGAVVEQVSSTKLFFNPSTGLLTSTDYNSSSDKRLKKNIKTVESALDKVIALRGVTFDWKEGGAKAIGLIAQEAEKVIPEIVSQDDNGYLGIKYNNLIGVLVEAIKEQQDQINTLKKLIEKQ